eukprot:TRINITY_DN4710_c0_g1_i1.p1 TRINITY_DN4710_c0_g1~~TRINITY_DN4710_c0_g1_i1.p1  ORF type:complete len:530 (+),score=125.42 TRINITY_DN4710_c0_g1_i1:44-1633(+)
MSERGMGGGVPCPLCDEIFPAAAIEAHCSTCGDQPASSTRKGQTSASSTPNSKPSNKRSINDVLSNKKSEKPGSAKKSKQDFLAEGPSKVVENGKDHHKTVEQGKPKDKEKHIPLAELMRPKNLEEYMGQNNVVGDGTQLRNLLEGDNVPSLILWGPPGCGKTSLANVIATRMKGKCRFIKMSACTCGVAEVRDVVKQAKNEQAMFNRRTILFMDEVHRFNKSQQDTFLPHVESGTITLIGATTENPSFSLNAALLSRCRVVVLNKLSPESLFEILERALAAKDIDIIDGENDIFQVVENRTISREALTYLTNIVDGDARSAINTLQLVIESTQEEEGGQHIDLNQVKEAAQRSHVLYDRTGDQHYFMASALQKSIRGSDDNAALYWLGRMLKGGEDPTFIARRLVRCASEDIGLGDPTAMPLAVAAFQGCQLIGKPECDVLLAQATVHLARAPKSHEVYGGLLNVYQSIEEGELPPVPLHLRNSTSKITDKLGWGKGYTHDLSKVQSLTYLPEELQGVNFLKGQVMSQ